MTTREERQLQRLVFRHISPLTVVPMRSSKTQRMLRLFSKKEAALAYLKGQIDMAGPGWQRNALIALYEKAVTFQRDSRVGEREAKQIQLDADILDEQTLNPGRQLLAVEKADHEVELQDIESQKNIDINRIKTNERVTTLNDTLTAEGFTPGEIRYIEGQVRGITIREEFSKALKQAIHMVRNRPADQALDHTFAAVERTEETNIRLHKQGEEVGSTAHRVAMQPMEATVKDFKRDQDWKDFVLGVDKFKRMANAKRWDDKNRLDNIIYKLEQVKSIESNEMIKIAAGLGLTPIALYNLIKDGKFNAVLERMDVKEVLASAIAGLGPDIDKVS